MRLLIAILLPWLLFFTIGRPLAGIICPIPKDVDIDPFHRWDLSCSQGAVRAVVWSHHKRAATP